MEEGGHVEVLYYSHSEKKKGCSQSGMYLKVRVFDLVSVPAKIFRLMLWVGILHLSCWFLNSVFYSQKSIYF